MQEEKESMEFCRFFFFVVVDVDLLFFFILFCFFFVPNVFLVLQNVISMQVYGFSLDFCSLIVIV